MDLNGSDLINRELVSINIAPLDFNQSTSSAQADQVITVVFRLIQIRKQSILLLNDLQERYNQLEQGEKQNINIIVFDTYLGKVT